MGGRFRRKLYVLRKMLRQRQINADPRRRSARLLRAVGGFFGSVADAAKWPFERLAWVVERELVWPLRERTAGHDLRRLAGAGALAAVAAGALAVGVIAASTGGGEGEQVAAPAALAVATEPAEPAAKETDGGPALQGVPPSFGVGKGVGVAERDSGQADPADAPIASSGLSAEPAADDDASPADETATASASSAPAVPAGPAAMKVARRFAEAFVFYEIGEKPARAETVFAETAAPGLAEALAERPPRQPAAAEVPKARVLNLVPGPRDGQTYTVSVSLLRLGLTSELRLEMQKASGNWLITDVRG